MLSPAGCVARRSNEGSGYYCIVQWNVEKRRQWQAGPLWSDDCTEGRSNAKRSVGT